MQGSHPRATVRRAKRPNDAPSAAGRAVAARSPVSPERADAELRVADELAAWRAHAVPDADAPLEADDLARLVRSCLESLGVDGAVGAEFSVNTVHYYRRKDILDAPAGRTSSARYDVRHLWQAVGARLAGYLGLVTLAEAREVLRGADEAVLIAFAAARVVDARARAEVRQIASSRPERREALAPAAVTARARPLPGVLATGGQPPAPVAIPLPGDAWCIVPASHAAHRSTESAHELVTALAAALGVPRR